MNVLINVVLPVFIVAGLAALAKARLGLHARSISRVAFYLFTPALVFDSLSTTNVGWDVFGKLAAIMIILAILMWMLGTLASRLMGLQGTTQAAFLVAILIMNVGNYGIPVNSFAFGPASLAPASVFFTMGAMLSASLGVFLSARGQASAKLALRRTVSQPLVYAAALGLLVNLSGWTVPEPLSRAFHLMGQGSVPTMLVVLGIKLADLMQNRQRTVHVPALVFVTVARLLLAPAIAWLLAGAMGLQGLARNVAIVEAAMPTAVITTILATEFETDSSFAALCVLVTTLISLPTLTLLLNLLQ